MINRDRKDLSNVILTAIMFGLTLNLISDFISSIPKVSFNSLLIIYRGMLSLIATTLTIMLWNYLANRDLWANGRFRREFETHFNIDYETGDVPQGVNGLIYETIENIPRGSGGFFMIR